MIEAIKNPAIVAPASQTVPLTSQPVAIPSGYVAPGSIVLGGVEAVRANIFGSFYDGPNTTRLRA